MIFIIEPMTLVDVEVMSKRMYSINAKATYFSFEITRKLQINLQAVKRSISLFSEISTFLDGIDFIQNNIKWILQVPDTKKVNSRSWWMRALTDVTL